MTKATRGEAFSGLSVALTTPFRDGEIDYDALAAQVEFQIAAGTRVLCPVGTTGESPTLSHSEHKRVIASAVEISDGRVKVMPGTGSNSTREALQLTKWAAEVGADAALVVAPYYNKPTQDGFLRALSRASRGNRPADLCLQHSWADRKEYRTGDADTAGPNIGISPWSRRRPA